MTFNKVKSIIVDCIKNINADAITAEARLSEDLGIDSIDAVEIIMAIESDFKIEIDDEAAQNIKTVADLVNYIDKSLK